MPDSDESRWRQVLLEHITGIANGDVLAWNGTQWTPVANPDQTFASDDLVFSGNRTHNLNSGHKCPGDGLGGRSFGRFYKR